jgi:hypothetical protein
MEMIDPLTNMLAGKRKKTSKMLTDAVNKSRGIAAPMEAASGYDQGGELALDMLKQGYVDSGAYYDTRRTQTDYVVPTVAPVGQLSAQDRMQPIPQVTPSATQGGYRNPDGSWSATPPPAVASPTSNSFAKRLGFAEGGMIPFSGIADYVLPQVQKGLLKYKYAVNPAAQNTIEGLNAVRGYLPGGSQAPARFSSVARHAGQGIADTIEGLNAVRGYLPGGSQAPARFSSVARHAGQGIADTIEGLNAVRGYLPGGSQAPARFSSVARHAGQGIADSVEGLNAVRGSLPGASGIEDAILGGGEAAAQVGQQSLLRRGLGIAGGPVGAGAMAAYDVLKAKPANDVDEMAAINNWTAQHHPLPARPVTAPAVAQPASIADTTSLPQITPSAPEAEPTPQAAPEYSKGFSIVDGKRTPYEGIGVKGQDPLLDNPNLGFSRDEASRVRDLADTDAKERAAISDPMIQTIVGDPSSKHGVYSLGPSMKSSEAFAAGLMTLQQQDTYTKQRATLAETGLKTQEAQAKIGLENASAEEKKAKAAGEKADADFALKHGFKMSKDSTAESAGQTLTPEAIHMYAQQGVDEGHLPVGVGGYGKVGQAVRNAISNEMAAIAKSQGLDNVALSINRLKNRSDQTSINQAQKILTMTKGYEDTVNNYIPILKEQRAAMNLSKFKKLADFEYAASKDFFGDANAQKLYGTLYETLVDYSKVVGGNFGAAGLTDAARREGDKLLAASNDPKTFNAVLDNFQKLMGERTKALTKVPQDIVSRYGAKQAAPAVQTQAQAAPPAPGARQAPDGKWYVSDPARPGKYLEVR